MAASPHQRGTRQIKDTWRWFPPRPGRPIHRDAVSQLCPRCSTEGQLPFWLRRQKQQQQPGEEASCHSIPAHVFPGPAKAAGRKAAGEEAGKVGICCLREQGEFPAVEEAIESSPNSFAANSPPSPKSLAPYMCLWKCPLRMLIGESWGPRRSLRKYPVQIGGRNEAPEEPGRAGPRGRRRTCEAADLAGPRG